MVATMPVIVTASASQRLPKAAANEVAGRDVAVLVTHVPDPREGQKQDRVDHDRVGHREEGNRARAESERGNRDEGVGGVEITADQEPGDDGAEAPTAEPPLVQLVEIALAPMGGGESQPGDESEQQHENRKRNPVHVLHGSPPSNRFIFRFEFKPARRTNPRSRNRRSR